MKLQHKVILRPIIQIQEEPFVTYVRTLMFQMYRFKDNKGLTPVHIEMTEIAKRFYPWPQYKVKEELDRLAKCGEVDITERISNNGNKIYFYKATKGGPVNIEMIPIRGQDLDDLTEKIMEYLGRVTLLSTLNDQLYFSGFLNIMSIKKEYIRPFFIVDDFCGRIHTPVTSLPGIYRKHILIDGQETISFDVATMQPLLLGKILFDQIGPNEFSSWIDRGADVYIMLQKLAGLESRNEGKDRFFKMLYSKPNDDLPLLFGNSRWITWVNDYKTTVVPENPHNKEKPHSNLAWLLQTEEVRLMRQVWYRLVDLKIPFLTVHDEIIARKADAKQTEAIMREVLSTAFVKFRINSSEEIQYAPQINIPTKLIENIVKHYSSYTLPYNISDPGDLESLVSGFIFETDIDIDAITYRTAVQHHQQPMDSNGKSEREET